MVCYSLPHTPDLVISHWYRLGNFAQLFDTNTSIGFLRNITDTYGGVIKVDGILGVCP